MSSHVTGGIEPKRKIENHSEKEVGYANTENIEEKLLDDIGEKNYVVCQMDLKLELVKKNEISYQTK